jgi:hypothetical protein
VHLIIIIIIIIRRRRRRKTPKILINIIRFFALNLKQKPAGCEMRCTACRVSRRLFLSTLYDRFRLQISKSFLELTGEVEVWHIGNTMWFVQRFS